MRLRKSCRRSIINFIVLGVLPAGTFGTNILQTSGFTTCMNNSTINVNNVDIQYDRSANTVIFDVSGSSEKVQNVTAVLTVSAYGKQVYQKNFDPCAADTKVQQLCPGMFTHKVKFWLSFQLIPAFSSCRQFRSARVTKHSVQLCKHGPLDCLLDTGP